MNKEELENSKPANAVADDEIESITVPGSGGSSSPKLMTDNISTSGTNHNELQTDKNADCLHDVSLKVRFGLCRYEQRSIGSDVTYRFCHDMPL